MCVHVYGALIQLPHQIKTDSENYDVNLRQEIESGCKLNPSHCFMSPCQSKFCFNRSVTVWVLVFNKFDDRCQSLDQMNYPILIPIKKKKMEANAHTYFQYFVTEYMYLYFYLQVS